MPWCSFAVSVTQTRAFPHRPAAVNDARPSTISTCTPNASLVAGDDLAFAAVHGRLWWVARRGGGAGASRACAARSRCAGAAAMSAARCERSPRRANGSRKEPSSSTTRSGKPSTRPQDCHSARMSSLAVEANSGSDKAGSPCSSTTAIALGISSAPSGRRRMATPRKALTGKFNVMRMPRTERRKHHALAV